MKASFVQRGEYIDYIPETEVKAGDVVLFGTLAGVSKLDIGAGCLGAVAVTGVYDIVKDAVAVGAGAAVYWDGEKATVCASNGVSGCGSEVYTKIGVAVGEAGETDSLVRVLLNA